MRQHRRRLLLQQFVVTARETRALFGRNQQRLCLLNKRSASDSVQGRFLLRQRLVNHHDEGRQFAQPLEGRILQDQTSRYCPVDVMGATSRW